jgi:hypothetical protein
MTEIMEETKSKFQALLTVLRLVGIETLQIHMDRIGVKTETITDGKELKISWSQSFRKDDPLIDEPNHIFFHPKYDLLIAQEEQALYRHRTIFSILFEITDRSVFNDSWDSEEVMKAFHEKQIMRTLWPFLRQQVADGMTRVGLTGAILPWIV